MDARMHALTNLHTHSLIHSLTHTHTLSHTHTHTLSLSLSHIHTHSLSHTHTHAHTPMYKVLRLEVDHSTADVSGEIELVVL